MILRIFLLVLFLTNTLFAERYNGRVVAVSDGDTIKVLDSNNVQHKIRFYGIDAPEKKQDYGHRAKQNLSKYIFNKHVIVDVQNKDRYGREVAVVYWEGSFGNDGYTLHNINLQMVLDGYAWAYIQYLKKADKVLYKEMEDSARLSKKGLWESNYQTPPWQWRKNKRSKK